MSFGRVLSTIPLTLWPRPRYPQGTNAHVLLQRADPPASTRAPQHQPTDVISWQHTSHWVAPPVALAISSAWPLHATANYPSLSTPHQSPLCTVLECSLANSPALAALARGLTAGGHAILPTGLLMEVLAAATAVLLPDASQPHSAHTSTPAALRDVTFLAPISMVELQAAEPASLLCLARADGSLELVSLTAVQHNASQQQQRARRAERGATASTPTAHRVTRHVAALLAPVSSHAKRQRQLNTLDGLAALHQAIISMPQQQAPAAGAFASVASEPLLGSTASAASRWTEGLFGSPASLEAALQLHGCAALDSSASASRVLRRVACCLLPGRSEHKQQQHITEDPASCGMHAGSGGSELRLVGASAIEAQQSVWQLSGLELATLSTARAGASPAAAAASAPSSRGQAPGAGLTAALGGKELRRVVRQVVAQVVGVEVGDEEPLMAAGLDSLGAAELRNVLQDQLQLQLPATLAFDYPTPASITSFLQQQLAAGSSSHSSSALAASLHSHRSPVMGPVGSPLADAVVGVCGMSSLPWSLLDPSRSAVADAISPAPLSRWDTSDPRATAGGAAGIELPPQFGAFLPAVELFDASLFGVVPVEAAGMDPQQRLLLAAVLEAAPGLGRGAASGAGAAAAGSTGVFVGVASSDYEALGQKHGVQVGRTGCLHFAARDASGACNRGCMHCLFHAKRRCRARMQVGWKWVLPKR